VSNFYVGEFPYTGTLDKVVYVLGAFPKVEEAKRSKAEAVGPWGEHIEPTHQQV
jgi:hypothetical protein